MPRANLLLITILLAAAVVNLVGAFGPETGFDALWYHLTIPKLYLSAGKIFHVPGGLLYYSELPRLGEMLFLGVSGKFGVLGTHLISWGAGIGAGVVTYLLARKFLSFTDALLAVTVFYVTPLVGWLSGSAYIDLPRTLFEILALYLVLSKKPILAGLAIGLAISTKTLALGSLIPLITVNYFLTKNFRSSLFILLSSFFICIPWFLSAYLNTGYSFYPIGAGILDATHNLNFDFWNLPKVLGEFWKLFLYPQDPITPIFIIFLPFFVIDFGKLVKKPISIIPIIIYVFLSCIIWYITPRTGGGRFILPYLPAWAILAAAVCSRHRILVGAVILISIINLIYRVGATSRLVPYLSGKETETQYLCRNLDTKVTYVNCTGFKPVGLTLVKGFHNLFYINFPFVHESWYQGERYNDIIHP